jgi:hypothetical protein
MITQMTYTNEPDNCREIFAWLGDASPTCKQCGGYGEYEGEYGPVGCGPCCSRLIPVTTPDGVQDADWGDTIFKQADGTFIVASEVSSCGS